VARAEDEVVVRLESGGGMVHAYGLAASQLRRIRDAGIPLTVAVDKIAASGGYLMACVADRVLAAPFAIVGSIGVVSQIPNFHRLLRRHDIDFEQVTAGEFKRTITLFGETTEKAREKLRQEVEDTHELFKSFVAEQRPGLDLATVATGEYWLASRALDLQLVDELRTSDDYLVTRSRDADLFQVTYSARKGWMERLSRRVQTLLADRAGSDDDLPTPML
jgi:serine protease SohB